MKKDTTSICLQVHMAQVRKKNLKMWRQWSLMTEIQAHDCLLDQEAILWCVILMDKVTLDRIVVTVTFFLQRSLVKFMCVVCFETVLSW